MLSACGPALFINSTRDLDLLDKKASRILEASESRTAPCPQNTGQHPRGVSEEVLVAMHGFSAEMLVCLVLAGLVEPVQGLLARLIGRSRQRISRRGPASAANRKRTGSHSPSRPAAIIRPAIASGTALG